MSEKLARILGTALGLNRFPAFCALTVGGSTLLPVLIYRLYASVIARFGLKGQLPPSRALACLVRFLSVFISSWFSFLLLNRKRDHLRSFDDKSDYRTARKEYDLPESERKAGEQSAPELAGRTLDLTLFAFTRALDVIACIAWDRWRRRRKAQNRWTFAESLVPRLADAGVFAASAAIVMWAWFYIPERLPRSYEKWIGEVAKVDSRLIEALRRARRGEFIYGKDTGQAPLLQSMCMDYNWPIEWGDPAKTIPIPCEMVHMGCGPNCEIHAASRLVRTFKFACATYLPLQLGLRLLRKRSLPVIIRAAKDAVRSSAFLAAFVSIFYYSVCLARTRLGPKLFDSKTVTPMMWDSGLCVGAGCLLCGWSILVENAQKRQEIALFVAPRAAATLLPRQYDKQVRFARSKVETRRCSTLAQSKTKLRFPHVFPPKFC